MEYKLIVLRSLHFSLCSTLTKMPSVFYKLTELYTLMVEHKHTHTHLYSSLVK